MSCNLLPRRKKKVHLVLTNLVVEGTLLIEMHYVHINVIK